MTTNSDHFSNKKEKIEAKYGLPRNVQFCKSCVISNQRPSSTIEFYNVIEEKKKTINFNEDGSIDDCGNSTIIPKCVVQEVKEVT